MVQIGLDFGTGRLKVAGVAFGWGKTELVGIGEVAIPKNAISKAGLNQADLLAKAVRIALQETHPRPLTGHRVTTALPASAVLSKTLSLPAMSPKELEHTVPYEASQAFPVAPEELYLDWHVLQTAHPKKTADPEAKTEVLVIGAPKILVDGVVSLFKELELELLTLEIKPSANHRAILSPATHGVYLILDIGAQQSSLTISENGQIRLISTVEQGGDQLKAAKTPDEFTSFIEEVLRVLAYYEQRQDRTAHATHLILCGGGAKNPLLVKALKKATKLTVKLGNPTSNLGKKPAIALDDLLPYTTAIGLALWQEKQ